MGFLLQFIFMFWSSMQQCITLINGQNHERLFQIIRIDKKIEVQQEWILGTLESKHMNITR